LPVDQAIIIDLQIVGDDFKICSSFAEFNDEHKRERYEADEGEKPNESDA